MRTPVRASGADDGGTGASRSGRNERERGCRWRAARVLVRHRLRRRRRGLPRDSLIELEFGFRLRDDVPGSSASSHPGGPRADEIGGGLAGSPMWVRMRSTGAASVMKATMRMSAPQLGQVSGMHSNNRASSIAQR